MQTREIVLITGTSSGFGQACARYLHRRGYRVFGTSRRAPAEPTRDAQGFELLRMDVDDEASVRRAVDQVLQRAGRVDVAVNNAGFGLAGAVEDTSIAEARAQLETNFLGAVRVCRAVLGSMRAQGGGTIINVSSLGGLAGIPFQAFYSASKFALEGFSEALRLEVAPFGIRVVLVEPGDSCTGFTANRRRTAASSESPVYRQRLERALAVMEADERNGCRPDQLSPVVERIIRARSPRVRYVVAPAMEAAALALKRVVPGRLFEWGVARYYRLR